MTGRVANRGKSQRDKETERRALAIEWLTSFDGTVWHYEGGYMAILEIQEHPNGQSSEFPEGLLYCFTFHEPGTGGKEGNRIYGLDNKHSPDKSAPYDHEHKTTWPEEPPGARPKESKPTRYPEASIQKAFEKFPKEIAKIMERLGLSQEAVSQSRTKRRNSAAEQVEGAAQTAAIKRKGVEK